jgi:hypothetical protein
VTEVPPSPSTSEERVPDGSGRHHTPRTAP